jgi:hypothetical protein
MRSHFLALLLIGVSALPATALAQREPAQADDETSEDIVVTGRAPPGAVIGDIPPENQLDQRAIASYGVGTVSELLDQIALQTGSAQDDQGNGPVILVNGRRVSGVNEVADLPTESILRVDILPEEVALKYGYSASQKVVNIILRRRFRSVVFNLGGGVATAGQGQNVAGDATLTRIRNNDRINIAARVKTNASLLEDERGIMPNAGATSFDLAGNIVAPRGGEIDPALSALAGQAVSVAGVPGGIAIPSLADFAALAQHPNVTDDTAYRTLSPSQRDYSLNAVYAHALSKTITSSFNFKAERTTSAALIGLPSGTLLVPAGNPYSPFAQAIGVARYFGTTPLDQDSGSTALHAGATVNWDITKAWRFSVVGAYDHSTKQTDTERGYDLSAIQAALAADDPTVSPYGPASPALLGSLLTSRAHNRSDGGSASALLTGPLFALPAGSVRTSIRVGGTTSSTSSVTAGAQMVPELDLSRTTGDVIASLDVPLASKHFLRAAGTLTASVNVSRNAVSDFETLKGFGYGLNWTPVKNVTLIAAVSDSQRAPSLQQLNSPTIATSNVRIYDYATGQTALVTRTSGGNRQLSADDRHSFKLGGTVKPFTKIDLSISANYVASRDRNAIGAFPGASASLEAAFPDRYTRDADGDLVAIDARPVNFARQEEHQLRWGLNFTQILRKTKLPRPPAGFVPRFRRAQEAPPPPPESGDTPPPPSPNEADATGAGGGGAAPGDPGDIVVTARNDDDAGTGGTTSRRRGFGEGRGRFGQGGFGGGFGGGGPRPGGGFGGAGGPPGGFGGGGGGARGADNGARLEISAYHTWIFEDKVLIRDGLPEVDLLHGGTLGGSAQPRHRIEFNAGVSDNGVGFRFTGQWQSAAKVTGDATSGSGTLHFSSLGTVNARAFINLQQRLRKETWARGVRLSLSVNNLFNQRQKVTDPAGMIPLAYQPGYIDPFGRTVAFSIRKIF